jgi:hypothetical protein
MEKRIRTWAEAWREEWTGRKPFETPLDESVRYVREAAKAFQEIERPRLAGREGDILNGLFDEVATAFNKAERRLYGKYYRQ